MLLKAGIQSVDCIYHFTAYMTFASSVGVDQVSFKVLECFSYVERYERHMNLLFAEHRISCMLH
jgi:hypothetical protein